MLVDCLRLLLHLVLIVATTVLAAVWCFVAGIKVFDDWVKGEFPYEPFGPEFRRKYGKRGERQEC